MEKLIREKEKYRKRKVLEIKTLYQNPTKCLEMSFVAAKYYRNTEEQRTKNQREGKQDHGFNFPY